MKSEKKYYIYRHYINENTFYIGSNYKSGDENRAWSKVGRNETWKEIVESNNGEYDIEILEYFDDKEQALKREFELQNYYWSINQCEASLQNSPEARVKIGRANSGEKNGMYGVTMSEKTKKKVSYIQKTRIRTVEEKEKIRAANIGKTIPENVRKKIKVSVSEAKKESRILINIVTSETISFKSVSDTRKWLKDNLSVGSYIQDTILYKNRVYKNWKLGGKMNECK
jgi:hypothetical protein